MTNEQRLQAIHDLASARLRNGPLEPNVEHDLKQIVEQLFVHGIHSPVGHDPGCLRSAGSLRLREAT